MTDYDDPEWGREEEMNSVTPTGADWEAEQSHVTFKNEHDVHTVAIIPATKLSSKVGKGIDPISKSIKTGFVPSGYAEANTADLTTANLKVDSLPKDFDERYIMACNNALVSLRNFSELNDIDVTPSYELVLAKRDLYNSMSKARGGKLLEFMFVHKSDQNVISTNLSRPVNPKKKTIPEKIFGSRDEVE